jgi:phage baseplate assembly protein W
VADVFHMWGSDLVAGPINTAAGVVNSTGDLLTVGGTDLEQSGQGKTVQRLLRRLLTNPGEYMWQPGYGAGLGRFLGQPISVPVITAVIRSQIFLEAAVAQSPAPVITVTALKNGTVSCRILYTDALTGKPTPVQFVIGT